MDAGVLEGYLREGLSLDKIGELTARHPTTVGTAGSTDVFAVAQRPWPAAGVSRRSSSQRPEAAARSAATTDMSGLSSSTIAIPRRSASASESAA
jgi:hypothetical protein